MKYRVEVSGAGAAGIVRIVDRHGVVVAEMTMGEWAFMISRPASFV